MSDLGLSTIGEAEPGQAKLLPESGSFVPLPWQPVTDAALLEKIKQTLMEFDSKEGELFRGLCRVAKAWNVQPGRFLWLLGKTDLPAPRASELKRVLNQPDLCDRFVRKNSKATWKSTLEEARKRDPHALDRAMLRL